MHTVSIGVHDQRPYVINDDKAPTYTGTMRGGFGNPWNMSTQSDKPLSDDIAFAVSSGFKRVGSSADPVSVSYKDDQQAALLKLKSKGAEKIVLITLKEFRSDTYTRAGFFIDAIMKIYDREGRELGGSSTSHKDVGSGDGTVQSPEDAARLHLSRLLNDPAVRTALTEVKKSNAPISVQSGASPAIEIIQPISPSSSSQPQSGSADLSEGAKKLRELKKLKDEGLLTEDEYEKKRKAVVEGL
ncbi:MAG: SHOCT domain-containing protein [Syntrophales bacterium LBB04]|nr:SHOCT domain-containing protein [Syntrophales bacterium LBB04]